MRLGPKVQLCICCIIMRIPPCACFIIMQRSTMRSSQKTIMQSSAMRFRNNANSPMRVSTIMRSSIMRVFIIFVCACAEFQICDTTRSVAGDQFSAQSARGFDVAFHLRRQFFCVFCICVEPSLVTSQFCDVICLFAKCLWGKKKDQI